MALVFLALLGVALSASTLNLHSLECQLVSDPSDRFHVAPSPRTPGSLELTTGSQSGDAIFVFGGQDDKGYHDSLYAFGTNITGGLDWKFIRGNKTINSVGRFGTYRTMSSTNYPSARSGSCMDFVTSSHALLFGGRGIDSTGKEGFLNDLWVSEDLVQFGHYGGSNLVNQKTVLEGKNATPGGRWKHTCAAHPEDKSFIVFGGLGEHPANPHDTAILDDLFLYGESGWTYLSGGSHSEVPDFDNLDKKVRNPGSRAEHASVMVESIFYTFGGQSVLRKPTMELVEVMMGDLWMYDLKTHTWAYVAGSPLANTHGAYPLAIGQGGLRYGPGARVSAAMAFNQLTNELFVFGGFGYGYIPGEIGFLNDLWSFNTVSNQFSWLGGSSGINAAGSLTTAATFPTAIRARSSPLLFSGNDGYEAELTILGGVADETKAKPSGVADVWMCNVQLPLSFTQHAPNTTLPPTTTETTTHTASTKATTHATTEKETTEKPATHTSAKEATHASQGTVHSTAKPTEKPTAHPVTHMTDDDGEDRTTETSRKPTQTTRTTRRQGAFTTAPSQSLFESGSPQKVAALVLGSFIAILLLVGGIVFLGFAFVSSPATTGSRSVLEPYNAV